MKWIYVLSTLVASEFKKARRKHFLLPVAAALFLNYLYLFFKHSPGQEAWYNVLFALPIINTLILSVLMAVIASQSVDLEHTGAMWNLLPTLERKSLLYVGKLLYGFLYLAVFCLLQLTMVLWMGHRLGFSGKLPLYEGGRILFAELIGGITVYQVQCLFSLLFSSQFAALSIGFGGTLTGLFLAYLSTEAWTPWSILLFLSPIGMDYDRAARTTIFFLKPLTLREALIALLYWAGSFALSCLVFSRAQEQRWTAKLPVHRASHSLHSALPVELIKLKRNPVWLPFLLLPMISATIGTLNFTQNLDVLQRSWTDLWTQQSLFLGIFFLSPLLGILCSFLWRMEHHGSNWNLSLTTASPARLVVGKWLTAILLSCLSLLWVALLYCGTGLLLRLPGKIPTIFWLRMLAASFSLAAIAAIQSTLSMLLHSFSLPIAFAFIGGLAGLGLTVKGLYYLTPYSMLIYGMGSTELSGALNIPLLFCSCLLYTLASLILGIYLVNRLDVRTQA